MAKEAKKERFKVAYREGDGIIKEMMIVYVDMKTGVNYLCVQAGSSIGLTPLLDKDGKPVITETGADDKGFFE